METDKLNISDKNEPDSIRSGKMTSESETQSVATSSKRKRSSHHSMMLWGMAGFLLTALLLFLAFFRVQCILQYRLTGAVVALLAFLAGGVAFVVKENEKSPRKSILTSLWASIAFALIIGILIALSLTPPPREACYPPQPIVSIPTSPTISRTNKKDNMKQLLVSAGRVEGEEIPAFWMDETEITNAMFAKFLEETGYVTLAERETNGKLNGGFVSSLDEFGKKTKVTDVNWKIPRKEPNEGMDNPDHPVVQVTLKDAEAYCKWAGRRLPTEREWKLAAGVGEDPERRYPWGNAPLSGDRANTADRNLPVAWNDPSVDDGYKYTAPVSHYLAGASPFGVLGMGGNVMEWVNTVVDPSESEDLAGCSDTNKSDSQDKPICYRVKGGSWYHSEKMVRLDLSKNLGWVYVSPGNSRYNHRSDYVGFRCAEDNS